MKCDVRQGYVETSCAAELALFALELFATLSGKASEHSLTCQVIGRPFFPVDNVTASVSHTLCLTLSFVCFFSLGKVASHPRANFFHAVPAPFRVMEEERANLEFILFLNAFQGLCKHAFSSRTFVGYLPYSFQGSFFLENLLKPRKKASF